MAKNENPNNTHATHMCGGNKKGVKSSLSGRQDQKEEKGFSVIKNLFCLLSIIFGRWRKLTSVVLRENYEALKGLFMAIGIIKCSSLLSNKL